MHPILIPFVIAAIFLLLDKKKRIFGWIGCAFLFVGFILYVFSFLANDFTLKEVFMHSSRDLNPLFKLSASWAGSGGFIIWWLFVFSFIAMLRRFKTFYYNLWIVGLLFVAIINGAFDSLDFVPQNGIGLNPLLKSIWMLLHPPASFVGYALGLLIAIDAFSGKENRTAIGITWFFITLANVLGGVWSYFTLGWGGYWAWDPVETALLLPWLSLTAYFHSKERYLLYLTGFSVVFAAFVTRGGISPLHGFAINSAGFAILLLGVPFLIKVFRDFDIKFDWNPMKIATYSLLGSYLVCFAGLIYQLAFTILGERVDVSVDYYNFANMPFIVSLLSVLPICGSKIRNYTKILATVYGVSFFLTALTFMGYINWCEDAPLHVNAAVSFILPIALFSFGTLLSLKGVDLKVIHFSLALLVISTSISWPYAYYGDYAPLDVQIVSTEFHEPEGSVFFKGIEIPEESYEVVKMQANGRIIEAKIRLNLVNLISGKDFILSEPVVISSGLDDYYLIVPNFHAYDLFMFTSKYLYENGETHLLMIIANIMGIDYDKFVKIIEEWEPTGEVSVIYKRIPLINLLWISCTLLLFGEILAMLARWRKCSR